MSAATSTLCSSCKAPLAPVRFVRTVRCEFCNAEQPNPAPLEKGQEVLVSAFLGRVLGHVVACDGPDRIEVRFQEATEARRLEELVPVVRLTAWKPGTQVFAKSVARAWETTWLVRVTGPDAVVKNASAHFQDSFFDRTLPLDDVRIAAQESLRHVRSGGEAFLQRLKGDPLGMAVRFIGQVITTLVILGMLTFVGAIVLGALRH